MGNTRCSALASFSFLTLLRPSHALSELSLTTLPRGNPEASYRLHRRQDGTVSSKAFSIRGAIYVNITVGTPPQPQVVVLDTGSSDLYLDAADSNVCQLPAGGPSSCRGGTFNSNASPTYEEVANLTFSTQFVDGTAAAGPFGLDYIGIGSLNIAGVQFGVAKNLSGGGDLYGLLGLGYSANEALGFFDASGPSAPYPNLLENMVQTQAINSRLYSIYLGEGESFDTTSGTVLFGGIDKSKYTGDLTTLNLLPSPAENKTVVDNFYTAITGVSVTLSGDSHDLWSNEPDDISAASSNHTVATLLDVGATAWTLKEVDFRAMAKALSDAGVGGTNVDDVMFFECSKISSNNSFSLTFGDRATIVIPIGQVVVESDGELCRLPIAVGTYGILGWTFMKSMYTVFDLDNGQVSIAQAAVNTSAIADIVEVQSGPNGIARAVSNAVTAAPNTWSIAPTATPTISNGVATLSTPIGYVSTFSTSTRFASSGSSTTASSNASNTVVASLSSTSDPAPIPTAPGSATCPVNGALVCNGSKEFGICNFGEVTWQKVAPGTGCFNGGIIGTGIYALPVATSLQTTLLLGEELIITVELSHSDLI